MGRLRLRAMDHDVLAAIARLRAAWDDEVRPAARRALGAVFVALVFAVAHLARMGVPLARAVGAGLLAGAVIALVVRAIVIRRLRKDVRHVVRLTVGKL